MLKKSDRMGDLCFSEDVSKKNKFFVRRINFGDNIDLLFEAQASIKVYKYEEGINYEVKQYNGLGVNSILTQSLSELQN